MHGKIWLLKLAIPLLLGMFLITASACSSGVNTGTPTPQATSKSNRMTALPTSDALICRIGGQDDGYSIFICNGVVPQNLEIKFSSDTIVAKINPGQKSEQTSTTSVIDTITIGKIQYRLYQAFDYPIVVTTDENPSTVILFHTSNTAIVDGVTLRIKRDSSGTVQGFMQEP